MAIHHNFVSGFNNAGIHLANFMGDETVIYANVVENCGYGGGGGGNGGIRSSGSSSLFNNTLFDIEGYNAVRNTSGDPIVVRNTLIHTKTRFDSDGGIRTTPEDVASQFSNNSFWNFDSPYVYYNAGGLSGVNDLFVDPLLSNPALDDFSLLSASPAIDAGTNTGHTVDFFGNPIYGAPDIGAIEYQPPYRMDSNGVDVAGNVRVYADGKFRNTASPTGTTANLTITPEDGWPTGDYREWMNISVSNWSVTAMTWTESSDIASNTAHALGVLPETDYEISVNGTPGYGLTNATIRSDASGVLAFVYTGGYSTNVFEVTASDGDALPDGWETLYLSGTNATEEADPDGDGMSNLEEWIAGTDPGLPAGGTNVFRVDIESAGTNVRVRLDMRKAEGAGYGGWARFYRLESLGSLSTGSWSALPGYGIITGENQAVWYTNGPAFGAEEFYRGKVWLE